MRPIFGATLVIVAIGVLISAHAGYGRIDGDLWLKWTPTERNAYMEGYVWGQMHGYNEGCDSAFKVLGSRRAGREYEFLQLCGARNPSAGIDFSPYADQITAYYSEGPANRNTPLPTLIDKITTKHRNESRSQTP